MGTNYYAKYNKCECCNRYDKLHLGKSSMGWKFMFKSNTEKYNNFKEFCKFIRRKDVEVWDDYGNKKSAKHLIDLIMSKQDGKSQYGVGWDEDLLIIEGYDFISREFE